ncbi:MAG: hypothetical protein LBL52_03545 [Rickettsiales bacterium]|jgi:hypothetical protein|nr:hypothetical protein [Rickettsiales bacterium]
MKLKLRGTLAIILAGLILASCASVNGTVHSAGVSGPIKTTEAPVFSPSGHSLEMVKAEVVYLKITRDEKGELPWISAPGDDLFIGTKNEKACGFSIEYDDAGMAKIAGLDLDGDRKADVYTVIADFEPIYRELAVGSKVLVKPNVPLVKYDRNPQLVSLRVKQSRKVDDKKFSFTAAPGILGEIWYANGKNVADLYADRSGSER